MGTFGYREVRPHQDLLGAASREVCSVVAFWKPSDVVPLSQLTRSSAPHMFSRPATLLGLPTSGFVGQKLAAYITSTAPCRLALENQPASNNFPFCGRDQQQYPSCARARVFYRLNPSRFGFDVAHYREITPRQEMGSPIAGQVMALIKRGAGGQQEERQHQEQGGDAGGEL